MPAAPTSDPRPATLKLAALQRQLASRAGRVPLGDIVDSLGSAGLGLTFLLLTLPSMIPIPGPFGMIFGSILAVLSLQLMAGAARLTLPGFVRRVSLPAEGVRTLLERCLPYLQRVEGWLRPRRLLALTGRPARMALSLPLLLSAVTLALPIPGGNVLPAASLVAFGLAFMTRDGAAVLAGTCFSLAGAAWGGLVVFAGAEAVTWVAGLFA